MRGHLARAAAVASVAFTLIEAVLGALLVKLGYTARSQSPMRPAFLALHLANTLLLLAALTLTAHLLGRTRGYLRGNVRLTAPFAAAAGILGRDGCRRYRIAGRAGRYALPGQFVGHGSGAGLLHGQQLAGALALDASGHRIRASFFLIWLLIRAARRRTQWDNRGLSALMLLLLAAVYTLGLLDVILLAPLWVQVAHLLAADSLWAALVVLAARLTLEPVEAGTEGPGTKGPGRTEHSPALFLHTRTSRIAAFMAKGHGQRVFGLRGAAKAVCFTADSGTVMVQGRGREDFMVPAIMLAISLVASSASASATVSTGCIIIAAVA